VDAPVATRRAVPRGLAIWVGGVSFGLLVLSLVPLFAMRGVPVPEGAQSWSLANVANTIEALGVCVLGILIGVRRPTNRVGWVFLVAGAALAILNLSQDYAPYALVGGHGPGWLGKAAAFLGGAVWPIPVSMLILLLLWFPTGEYPSARWRPVGISVLVLGSVFVVAGAIIQLAIWNDPFTSADASTLPEPARFAFTALSTVAFIGLPVLLVLALVSVIVRYRRSRGDERLQLKWFAFAAVFVVITFVFNTGDNPVWGLLSALALLGLWVAIGIAMLRYRLYDIDVVIRKTLVGGVLVAFVTVVYAVIVAGIGALGSSVGLLDRGPLIALATAVVAIAAQPVLRRARHLADRLVYGDRATPYEVLSEFSERMGETYSTDEVPQRMARILAEGTGATAATVWLHVGGRLRPAATWPADVPQPDPVPVPSGDAEPSVGDARTFAVRHAGELLGALSVSMPPDEPMSAVQERLGTDLAAQAGLVLRNVRLIEELRASRQRLVVAQDEERRKLERNLHDGAQQQLVALAVKERLAANLVERDPAGARSLLEEIQTETTDALETLRDLARGIYPPLLADGGLRPALEAQARKAPLPVEVETDGIGRYPREVEAAVYFACLEALQNVSKYAEADRAWVAIGTDDGELVFRVRDDGRGFDPASTNLGTGIQGIDDRLAALGGRLRIDSSPGAGAVIEGRLPVANGREG